MHVLCIVVLAVLSMAAATSLTALPKGLRNEVLQKHAQGKAKHAATGQPWSAEMDAWVILRHKRDGVPLAQLAREAPAVAEGRKKDAIQSRWKDYLKKLPSLETVLEPPDMEPEAIFMHAAAAQTAASTLR